MTPSPRWLSRLVLALVVAALTAGPASSQTTPRGHGAEAHDMELVGHDELQGRSAYQPTIHKQRGRFIAYVGHHGGRARNPLTGVEEDNGTSIVDVTDAARPRYLAHIPGPAGGSEQGGAQMARVCDRGGRSYLLRTYGNAIPNSGHEVWDVTEPAKPQKTSTVVTGLTSTHKNWWECDTGIAYLVSGDLAKADPLQLGPSGWRTWRMTKIYDLSDPAKPVFIRDFGLAGQEPGSTGPITVKHGVHGPIVLGNRVYFAYGTSGEGVLQIVDRQKLLSGPREPTAANLNAPEISRLWMSPNWGGHTSFPILGVPVTDWAPNTKDRVRDFVFLVSEAIANECRESRHASFVVDITAETRPFGAFLRRRSSGIRDLRQGSLVDEDWQGRDPEMLRAAACREVPLLDGATHCFVSAAVTRGERHPVGRLVGDCLVLVPSASGRGRTRRIPFRAEHGAHVAPAHHFALLNHPRVYENLRDWLATAPRELQAEAGAEAGAGAAAP